MAIKTYYPLFSNRSGGFKTHPYGLDLIRGQTSNFYQNLASGNTQILLTVDVTGDGQKELITATITGDIDIWSKTEIGLYHSLQRLHTPGITSIQSEDVTENGCPDLIVIDGNGNSIVFINDCNGFFTLKR